MKINDAGREEKIRLAFPAYEAAKRAEHLNVSLRQFPTGTLEQELHKLMAEVREEVRMKYAESISALEHEIAVIHAEIEKAKKASAKPAVLRRSYKSELAPLYEQLRGLAAESRVAQVAKQEAYAHLESAHEQIENWHNKSKRSPFLAGNSGRALPKHSFFGQSLGDLNGYKVDRSNAASDITRHKKQVELLNSLRREVSQKIELIKAEQQRKFDLKTQDKSIRESYQSSPHQQVSSLRKLSLNLSKLRTERGEILDAARYRTGAIEVERLILKLKLRRDDFVSSFDEPAVAAARYASHVEDWINAHGR
ncbi:MAG: hypothetical protein ACOH2S_13150 [Janthinobacterium svalbardensis]